MTEDTGYLRGDSKKRKGTPIARGVLDYFPAALAAVAQLSKAGNDKHNPGEEMHHARGKSTDHADCIVRHLIDRGTVDEEDGILHDVKVAWRALAMLQEELERRGEARLPRAARLSETHKECPNHIEQRIAGDTNDSRRLKHDYYFGKRPGAVVFHHHLRKYGVIIERGQEYDWVVQLDNSEQRLEADALDLDVVQGVAVQEEGEEA